MPIPFKLAVPALLCCIFILVPPAAEALSLPPPNAVSPQTVKLPDGPASVRGLVDSSSANLFTGQVSYELPIELPPGLGGFGPSVALAYEGGRGNGPIGVGWSIELASIRRSTRHGVPTYSNADELELTGLGSGRLVEISPDEFRVEGMGNTVRVIRRNARFEVFDGDGNRYLFGSTPDSRSADGAKIAIWWVDAIVTPGREIVRFSYDHVESESYPSSVRWGPGESLGLEFLYDDRPDAVTSYRSGFRVVTSRRLSGLAVSVGPTVVRQYELSYDDASPLSRLQSVRMVGRDGTALPELRFAYGVPGPVESRRLEGFSGWRLGDRGVSLFDVDGNGATDFLRTEAGGSAWLRNDGTEFLGPRPISGAEQLELSLVRFLDIDGDARAEMVHVVNDEWRTYRMVDEGWVAGGAVSGTRGVPLFGADQALADLNGDGRSDLVRAATSGLRIAFATDSGFAPWVSVAPINPSNPVMEPGNASTELLDYNGDGLSDAVWFSDRYIDVLLGRGDGSFAPYVRAFYPWGTSAYRPEEVQLHDLDRDGLSDLVRITAGNVTWYRGDALGRFAGVPRTLRRPAGADADVRVAFGDLNANGSTDIVWSSAGGTWALDLVGGADVGLLAEIDNGLGRQTRFRYSTSALLAIDATRANTPWVRHVPTAIPVPVRQEVLVDGKARVQLFNVRDGYWDGDERRFGGFLTSLTTLPAESKGDIRLEETRYHAGLGANRVLRGKPWFNRVSLGTGEGITTARNELKAWSIAGLPGDPLLHKPVTISTRTLHYEGRAEPLEHLVEFSIDSEGRVQRTIDHGRTDMLGDEKRTGTAYVSGGSLWLRDLPCEESVYDANGAVVQRNQTFYGSEAGQASATACASVGKGWPVKTQGWLANDVGGGRWVTLTHASYDDAGNVIRSTQDGVTRSFTYSPDARFPVSETVQPTATGTLKWELEWDLELGKPIIFRDPNSTTTRLSYDGLGRPSSVALNNHLPHLHYVYDWAAPRPQTFTYIFDGPLDDVPVFTGVWSPTARWRQTIQVTDGASEKLFTATRLASSTWIVDGWTERDDRGRVTFAGEPAYWTGAMPPSARPPGLAGHRIEYDGLDRIRTQTSPTGETRANVYAAFSTSTTVSGQASVHFDRDAHGRTIHTTRTIGGITESVEAFYAQDDQITLVDLQHGTATQEFAYDTLGRLVWTLDPDIGLRRLEYDDAGRLVRSENGDGQVLTISYDAVGRMFEARTDGALTVYHYDTAAAGGRSSGPLLGRLTWIEEPRVDGLPAEVHVSYDEAGRQSQVERILDGKSARESLSFTASGLTLETSFDDGFSFATRYDAAGRPFSIDGLWEALEIDPSGRIRRERFGNSVEQVNTWDLSGRLSTARVSLGATTLYDVEVGRNASGLLSTIIDRHSGGLEQSASFGYDHGGRLVSAQVGAIAHEFAYRYDALQNMIWRGETSSLSVGTIDGEYEYGKGGRGPRQLSQIVPPSGAHTNPLIESVAGGGGDDSDWVPGEKAAIDAATGVALTGTGQLLWSERIAAKVRGLDTRGLVSTRAGGRKGYSGDGGDALAAELYEPTGVSVGRDGRTVYIADSLNHVVRAIDERGEIRTFAGNGNAGWSGDGGPAVDAELFEPQAVVEAADGTIYIADSGNHVIRRVSPEGDIETIIGTPQEPGYGGDGEAGEKALLDSPLGLSLSTNALYIADTKNHAIRRYDFDTNDIETVAGGNDQGFDGDGDLATKAKLDHPTGVVVGANDTIFIADMGNHRIRKIDAYQKIETYAGGGTEPLGSARPALDVDLRNPVALALGPDNVLYVAAGDRVATIRPEQRPNEFFYDASGRVVDYAGAKLAYDGLDNLREVTLAPAGPAVGWANRSGSIRYGYGFDGIKSLIVQPDGQREVWFTPALRELPSGRREHYVRLGDRLIARVSQLPVAAGPTPPLGAFVLPEPGDVQRGLTAVLLLLALAVAICSARSKAHPAWVRAAVPATFATFLLAACGGYDTGASNARATAALWETRETLYFHTGASPGPTLMTDEHGRIAAERLYEPFGQPIESYSETDAGEVFGTVQHGREPHNSLNKDTDPLSGWSYHGARWHSPQTARWLTPDPVVKGPQPALMESPWDLNPYSYARQDPVQFWDPDGRYPDDSPGWDRHAAAVRQMSPQERAQLLEVMSYSPGPAGAMATLGQGIDASVEQRSLAPLEASMNGAALAFVGGKVLSKLAGVAARGFRVVSAKLGGRTAKEVAHAAAKASGNALDVGFFKKLVRNPDVIKVGRSGKGRPLTGPENSYSMTTGGHALVFGPDGRLLYDVSKARIKAFEWNRSPSGQWFPDTGSDFKSAVPADVLKALGMTP